MRFNTCQVFLTNKQLVQKLNVVSLLIMLCILRLKLTIFRSITVQDTYEINYN